MMWTKAHKIFFAALLLSKIPSLNKNTLKQYGFSAKDYDLIVKLAADFKTGDEIANDKIEGCLTALRTLVDNKLARDLDFLVFCEYNGPLNANALSYLCNNKLYKDTEERTTLFSIAYEGTKADAERLLKAGAKVDARDTWGYTPLTLACINNNIGVAEALIAAGADVNCLDKEGVTPLHLTAQLGHSALFELLIDNGAKKNVASKNGKTPFYLAVLANKYAAARILIEDFHCAVDHENKEGATALQDACISYNQLMLNSNFKEADKIYNDIKLLLELGANVNREFINKNPPIDKTNYFAAAMLVRISKKNLHDLDYKLATLFTTFGFNFSNVMIADNVSMMDYIIQSKDVRLAICCKIARDTSQTVIEVSCSNDKLGYMFYPALLTDEQKAALAEKFKVELEQLLIKMHGELHQIFSEEFDISKTERDSTIATTKPISDTLEKKESQVADQIHTVAQSILDLQAEYYNKFSKYGQYTVPNWCKAITLDKLELKSLTTLQDLKIKIEQWGENALRQLQAKQFASKITTESIEPKSTTVPKELPSSAIYEETLPYLPILMLDVSEYCGLLRPFNQNGEVGLDAIFDADKITPDDRKKFERVIADPKISHNPNQPGIRFLNDANYFCHFKINQQDVRRLIIAEIKIADSPHRIALCRLQQKGSGKMVLVCVSYVKDGFHDSRYQNFTFQGFPLDLSSEFIDNLIKRLLSKTSEPRLVAPAATLSLLKPPPASAKNSVSTTVVVQDNKRSGLVIPRGRS